MVLCYRSNLSTLRAVYWFSSTQSFRLVIKWVKQIPELTCNIGNNAYLCKCLLTRVWSGYTYGWVTVYKYPGTPLFALTCLLLGKNINNIKWLLPRCQECTNLWHFWTFKAQSQQRLLTPRHLAWIQPLVMYVHPYFTSYWRACRCG